MDKIVRYIQGITLNQPTLYLECCKFVLHYGTVKTRDSLAA